MLPENVFLYFLCDDMGRSYTVQPGGEIIAISQPTPLKNKPIGWREIELSFGTQAKYFSNVKALSVPLQYVLDGADILRFLKYKGKGPEENVYCKIFKWNSENGQHELEYNGKLDISKAVDDPQIGVTLPAKEGGLQSDLDANEDVTYELPLDQTNPDAIRVLFDGVQLFDKYNYKFYKLDLLLDTQQLLPSIFINNEGDSVGIIHGDTNQESLITAPSDYYQSSGNYIFSTAVPITGIRFSGDVVFSFRDGIDPDFLAQSIVVVLRTSLDQAIFLVPFGTIVSPTSLAFHFDVTFDLAAEEKLFGPVWATSDLTTVLALEESSFSIEFSSRNAASCAWALPPLPTVKQLISKASANKYTATSSLFTTRPNIVATSGQALRELPNAVLKYSCKDWFDDYNNQYCLCANVVNDVWQIELRKVRYASNSGTIIFNLDTVTDLKVIDLAENITNTVLIGWPDQEYDERNGKYEFNSQNEFKEPINNNKGELNLISKGRGDCYGIEFIRGKLNNKNTTDNKGDNEVFLVNVTQQAQLPTGTYRIDYDGATKTLKLYGQATNIAFFPVDKYFETINPFVPDFNYALFRVVSATANGSDLDIVVTNAPAVSSASVVGYVSFPYKLTRKVYDTQPIGLRTPNIDGPGAVFNLEEMTPRRKEGNWESYERSILAQVPGEKVTFQTGKKNTDLVTVLNGITISEKADFMVAEMEAPFFYNYDIQFTTIVPLTFSKTLKNLSAAGSVRIMFNGFQIFLLPIGKMKSKPATNEAQQWQLRLAANNNIADLMELGQQGLFINDGMNNTARLTVYNPVHFNYYNKQLNGKYKYKDLFDDWFHHRNDQFATQPAYIQKWQNSDTIYLQSIPNGLGQLELYIYDADAIQVDVMTSTIYANTSILAPFSLQQFAISPGNYEGGLYIFVIKANGIPLMISEWQSFAEVQPGTYLHEYYGTTNRLNAYWLNYRPMLRVEAEFDREKGDGGSFDYTDEKRLLTLDFDTYSTKKIRYGGRSGIPDWMQLKLNNILYLDRMSIEDTRYTRPQDAKWEITEPAGYPMMFATIELRRASNTQDLSVTETGARPSVAALYTLEAEAFGQGTGVLQIELDG